jgi:hypothetical protein
MKTLIAAAGLAVLMAAAVPAKAAAVVGSFNCGALPSWEDGRFSLANWFEPACGIALPI